MLRLGSVGLVVLALCAWLSGCQHAAEAGASCSASSECSAPLVCRLARCRNECTASRDCPPGARCLLDPSGLGACSLAIDDRCESGGAACPTGLTCLGMRCVNTCTGASECPTDGECREVAGAGVSFCFAPTREDGGVLDAAAIEDAFVRGDTGTQTDAATQTDAGVLRDAGPPIDGGPGCTSASCAIDVCIGETFACAVRGDHGVVCWGGNQLGQLGDGVDVGTPRAHPTYSCLDSGGVGPIDCSARPVEVLRADSAPLLADAIACSTGAACAREAASGGIFCWGEGGNGELASSGRTSAARATELPAIAPHALTISAGRAFFCATFAAPTSAVCWGDDNYGQWGLAMGAGGNPADVPHWSGQALVTGGTATCGLDATGVVRCAGSNLFGEIGPSVVDPTDAGVQFGPVVVPMPSGTVTSLVAGDSFECALVDGVPHCWGFGETGSLGRMTTGTCAGYMCDAHPSPVGGATRLDTLWVEGFTSRICGRSGASTYCWGAFSQIGCEVGGGGCWAPREIPALAGARQVVSSTRSMCAILADGALVCAGNDYFGQLGRGSVGGASALATDYVAVCLAGGC